MGVGLLRCLPLGCSDRSHRSGVRSLAGVSRWRMERLFTGGSGSRVLIAYFSWGGNTRGAAKEIARQTGAGLFEITMVEPYSTNYNTVPDQAQADQNIQARPDLAGHVENMASYDTILLGYPNWWASIPMPVASFPEEYDFSGKTVVPFATSGGSGMGKTDRILQRLCPSDVRWLPGKRLSSRESAASVRKWIDGLNI